MYKRQHLNAAVLQEADFRPHACGYDYEVALQLGAVVQHHGGDPARPVPAGVRGFGGEEEAAAVGFKALLVLSGGVPVQDVYKRQPQPGSEYGVVYSNQGKGITFTDGGGTPVFQVMPRNRSGRAVTVRQCTVYRFKASSAQAVQNCGHTVRVFNDMVDLVNTEKRMIADLYDRYGIE